ncbi:hypothetical protein BDF19DRAFT_421328 [Syncephalis fuscata]|nr:hypothetical protein BDF19DRAFT_421328 [Syncephalis fuscata]
MYNSSSNSKNMRLQTFGASAINVSPPEVSSGYRLRDRRASITTETNTATPSAPAFVPSKERLDHSLVLHDNTGLAVHSANLPSESVRPDAYVESEARAASYPLSPEPTANTGTATSPSSPQQKLPFRYFRSNSGNRPYSNRSSSPLSSKDPEHTNDDEQVRIQSATIKSTAAVHDVQLGPDEFGRITSDVQRVSQNHCPPDWHRDEEVDRSSVPGAEEYLERHNKRQLHAAQSSRQASSSLVSSLPLSSEIRLVSKL